MKQLMTSHRSETVAVAVAMTLLSATAQAAVLGFNGNQELAGWQYNQTDTGTPLQIVGDNAIQFTAGPNNRRSLWFTTPQDITQFEANFTYRASSISASASRQGLAFVIQNSPSGVTTLGGASYGYNGITPSAAVTIETDSGPGRSFTGYYTNGVLGGGSADMTPVNAYEFTDIDVNVRYQGSVLSVTMTQGTDVFGPRNYFVGSLASLLGSPTAYVGFTGATLNTQGAGGGATQFLSNFSFVPEPTTGVAMLVGLMALRQVRR
ncbi:MAG: hypothetical protein SF069_11160 [Phycisphaerae bacterium]|nr:hypothetical protein [Phycisphaerae bacterium]